MRNLLKTLSSTILISSTVLPVVACKSNKTNQNDKEYEDSYSEMTNELKEFIIDFFNSTKATAEGKQSNDFSILSTKELGISSLSDFAKKLQSEGKIDEQGIIDLINNYIKDNRLPILEKALKNNFSDTFAEDIEDFIHLNDNETIISNDSKSLKVDQIAKILSNNNVGNQKLSNVLRTETVDNVVKSIIKLNIKLSITLRSKSFNMKIDPDFSYYITDKEEATKEVIAKLKTTFEYELRNNISSYYQQFLYDKLLSGINITKNIKNLTATKIVREVLDSYISINGISAGDIDLKIGKVLTSVISSNSEKFDLDHLINYKSSKSLVQWLQFFDNTKTNDSVFDQYIWEELQLEYDSNIKKIVKDDGEKFEIIKMKLELGRINILGFAIGDLTIDEVPITFDIKNIIKDMYSMFLYLREILKSFDITSPNNNISIYLQPLIKEDIWNPEDYKGLPYVPYNKPDDMPQEDYDARKKLNEDAVKEIINVKLVNWLKRRLNETLNSDGGDLDVALLEITAINHQFIFGDYTDYEKRVNVKFDLKFKLRGTTFTIYTGIVYWYNPAEEVA